MAKLAVPSKRDWGEPGDDLDRAYSFKKFSGKTYDEAFEMFVDTDILSRAEDLDHMPDVPFRYYVLVFKDFVLSRRLFQIRWGMEPSTAASAFLDLIESKLKDDPAMIRPVLGELLLAAQFVAERQAEYGADEDIYGNFLEQMQRIRALAAEV